MAAGGEGNGGFDIGTGGLVIVGEGAGGRYLDFGDGGGTVGGSDFLCCGVGGGIGL